MYLENGKPYIIESVGVFDITLSDPTLFYPISRAESRESFARLMERYPQPEKTATENTSVPEKEPKPAYTEETVAVYPGDKNNLPYEKRRLPMANRKRNIQMKFYVTEEEKRLIDEKMAQLPTRRYGAYLRKMAIDGYIIQLDTTDIKRMNAALSAIGRNINQIAKRINAGGGAYKADMREIQERLNEIWQLQRRSLSSGR